MFVEFYNGSEKIRIYDVTMGKKTISSKDTIHIDFIEYDTYIDAIYEDGIMEGKWIVNYKENYSVLSKLFSVKTIDLIIKRKHPCLIFPENGKQHFNPVNRKNTRPLEILPRKEI
ncbi:MAG: hypothetical protein IPL63_14755 [Saprospiraceae bacterium]|nr:hypothetical protein [Saprospiraceae bacterium]